MGGGPKAAASVAAGKHVRVSSSMTAPDKPAEELESLTRLAKSFADRRMLDEASDLFELALRFAPDNLGLKLNLAQVRYRQRQSRGRQRRGAEEELRENLRRAAIDSAHFFGLAALYEERGEQELAAECLQIARHKDLANPYVHKLSGRIFFRQRRFDEAADELRAARRYNPFDRQIAELLGRVEYERGNYREALEATIDAFLLLSETDREKGRELINRIRELKTVRKITGEELVGLFHERRDKLQTSFDRLELYRERFVLGGESRGDEDAGEAEQDPQSGRIELAVRLREFEIWSRLDDQQVFHLTQAAHEERRRKGSKIFEYGSDGTDIYVLEKGRISIRRPTSYGNFELGILNPGTVFGEVNFITRSQRTGEAVAIDDCRLVRLDGDELEVMITEWPDLGVEIYLSFWHGLAKKLRGANDQLRTFFASERTAEELLKMRQDPRVQAGDVDVQPDEKIALLREQGLTGAELVTLADFSNVKQFPGGRFLFHEGDAGDEMYVILEGQVMISKLIPGGGEEALAILGRGDFFGEMALIDGEPRSADAKAFQGPVTAIAFDEKTLKEVLAMESRSALDFMKLLCRLICKRLREIDEKVTGWRIMSGSQPVDEVRSTEFPTYRSA